MAKGSKVPKSVAKLRELGFKPFTEILSPGDLEKVKRMGEGMLGFNFSKLPRQDRRRLIALKLLPAFSRSHDGTYAVDETGVEWSSDDQVDLTPFGFKDTVEGIKEQVPDKSKFN